MSETRPARGAQGRIGTAINGKWQVDDRIGSGGMATVYSATHRNGHRAAIKMLHAQLSRDPSTRARFLREGYVANAVGHPGVVAVLDDGIAEDGCAFLVLELLEGETIEARRLRLGGKLPLEEVLELADQALDALGAAHDKGIIHRDVKPENVFLTKEGQIKLLDFGLARMKDAQGETTKTGVTIGTPEFMPPEQAMGRREDVDARSDLWGLGATLFTALAGRYVHDDAMSLHEQLIASATRRSPPIRSLVPNVPPAIGEVVDRALELEMSDRWQSAAEMKAALRTARTYPEITSRPDSATVTTPLRPKPTPRTRAEQDAENARIGSEATELFSLDHAERAMLSDNTMPIRDTRALRRSFPEGQLEGTYADPHSPGPTSRRSNRPPAPEPTARMRATAHPSVPPPPPPTNHPASSRRSHPAVEDVASGHGRRSYASIDDVGPTLASPNQAPWAPPPEDARSRRDLYNGPSSRPSPQGFRAEENPAGRPPALPSPRAHHGPQNNPIGYVSGPDASFGPPTGYDHGNSPPTVMTRPASAGAGRAVLVVSLILLVLCAAMGAYVLTHAQAPVGR